MGDVIVTMGGEVIDGAYSAGSGKIEIAAVKGDVTITAVATKA